MKQLIKDLIIGWVVTIFVAVFLAYFAWTVMDAAHYHHLVNDKKNVGFVSWYAKEWYKQPYTHFRLSFYPHQDIWSHDGAGNPILEREVTLDNGKKFWTILNR